MKIEVKKRGVQQLRIVDIKIPKSSSSLTTILIITLRVVGDIYIPIPGTYLHGNYTRSRLSPFHPGSAASCIFHPMHLSPLHHAIFTSCTFPHASCIFHSYLHLSLMSASFTHVLSAPYISGNYS